MHGRCIAFSNLYARSRIVIEHQHHITNETSAVHDVAETPPIFWWGLPLHRSALLPKATTLLEMSESFKIDDRVP